VLKGAIARRYAEAVLAIAVEQNTLERWRADLRLIGEAFGNRQLAFVLREPKIRADRKELIVRDLLASRVQPDALNLALLLVRDGLVEIAPRLAQEFERLYNDYRGQAVAEVTTVTPLNDNERALIARKLQALTGKRILLEERVDPSILGGVVARVGDTLIDGSVRRRLALLRDQLIQGGGNFGGPLDGEPSPDGSGPSGDPAGGAPAGGGTDPFIVGPPAGGSGDGSAPPAAPDGPASASSPGGSAGGGSAGRPASALETTSRPLGALGTPRLAPQPVLAQVGARGPQNRRQAGRNKKRRR
jgi:ATP synthase F1 delta subunit